MRLSLRRNKLTFCMTAKDSASTSMRSPLCTRNLPGTSVTPCQTDTQIYTQKQTNTQRKTNTPRQTHRHRDSTSTTMRSALCTRNLPGTWHLCHSLVPLYTYTYTQTKTGIRRQTLTETEDNLAHSYSNNKAN